VRYEGETREQRELRALDNARPAVARTRSTTVPGSTTTERTASCSDRREQASAALGPALLDSSPPTVIGLRLSTVFHTKA